MSNTNTNFDEFEVVALPEGLPPETEEQLPTEQVEEKPKKTGAARFFSAILAVLSVLLVFLPINVIKGTAVESASLLNVVLDMFKNASEKLFGALPAYASTATTLGTFTAISVYLLLVTLVLSLVFGVIGLFSKKKAPALLRATAFFFATGVSVYTVFTLLNAFVQTGAWKFDFVCLGLTAVACLIYFVLGLTKVGKSAWVMGLQYLFTAVTAVCVYIAVSKDAAAFENGLNKLGLKNMASTMGLVFFALMFVLCLVSAIRVHTKKGLVFDLIRYILALLVASFLCFLVLSAKAVLTFAIVAAVVALVQIIICAIQIKASRPKKEEPVEEPAPVVEEFIREEYAEAVAYEGGPVEGVEIAEEVNPTFISTPPQVNTAGYDFYNCKSFDPFIAILNNEERNQFTELFIVKFKGVMPEIPDYEVGGDNKEFFRKLFIYLGQYRDRIPDGLLAKIYQYAIKLS